MSLPQYTIIQYLRHKNKIPYGVLVAVKAEDGCRIGYSLCNKNDRFEKKMALKIAIGRANFNYVFGKNADMPYAITKALPQFIERCGRYYK
jgi:hypothetical protein